MSISFIDKLFKDGSRTNYKLIFSLACVLYFSFGIFINILNTEGNDPLWMRLGLSLIGLSTVAYSYKSAWANKNFETLLTFIMFMFNFHFYYLLLINDFDPGYKMGLLVGVVSTLIFINNKKILSAYILFNVLEFTFLVALTQQFNWPNTTLGFLIFTVLILGYLTNNERQAAFVKLRSNEALLKSINNNVLHGIYRMDAHHHLIYCNEHFLSMLGFRKMENINKQNYPINFAQKTTCNNFLWAMERNETVRNKEVLLLKKNGQAFWAIISQTPVCDSRGNVIYYDGSIIDISEQKKTEKDLQIFSAAINYSPSAVVILEKDGCIKYANPEFVNFTKTPDNEVEGRKIWEFGLKGEKNLKKLVEKMNNGKNWKGEISFIDNQNQIKTHLASIAPIIGDKNQVLNYVLVSEDITAMKEKERELNFAKELAEDAMKAKEHFLSTMSHELRTPMNAVIGCTNLLMDQNPDKEEQENLEILKFSANNLLAIINDILDLSKIDAGKLSLSNEAFDPRKLFSKIEKLHSVSAKEKEIALELHFDKNIPQQFNGDPNRLNQILNNLISNAIKFTHKGKVSIHANCNFNKNNKAELTVKVKDSGIGIPKEKQQNIFDSFTQVHSHKNDKLYGGTGLGLTITKKLIELQNGSISIESKVGKGSEFTFTLPLSYSQVGVKEAVKELNSNKKSLKGIHILVVEDNPINRKIATRFLEKWDITISIAENGVQAIDSIKENTPDLILMDLQMPVMDGYEATKKIRKIRNAKIKKLPIIALSASATTVEKKRAIESGVNHYITKPFKPEELRSSIEKLVLKKVNAA
ncbi:MAG: ATP-binding protein [Chitinophagales bacterium]